MLGAVMIKLREKRMGEALAMSCERCAYVKQISDTLNDWVEKLMEQYRCIVLLGDRVIWRRDGHEKKEKKKLGQYEKWEVLNAN